MPRKIEAKPTREESKAAVDLQAPPKRSKPTQPVPETATPPPFRKLSEVGIDGSQKTYLKIAQLFESDEADVSEPFIMTGAREKPNNLKPGTFQIDFAIRTKTESGEMEDYLISLSSGRLEGGKWFPDAARMEFVGYFQTNTVPLGWLELHKLPSSKPGQHPYYAIHQVPDEDIPF